LQRPCRRLAEYNGSPRPIVNPGSREQWGGSAAGGFAPSSGALPLPL